MSQFNVQDQGVLFRPPTGSGMTGSRAVPYSRPVQSVPADAHEGQAQPRPPAQRLAQALMLGTAILGGILMGHRAIRHRQGLKILMKTARQDAKLLGVLDDLPPRPGTNPEFAKKFFAAFKSNIRRAHPDTAGGRVEGDLHALMQAHARLKKLFGAP